MAGDDPHLPRLAPIEAYGKGGFRFADMSHRGSILCLPAGIWAWPVASIADLTISAFAPALAAAPDIDLFVLGSGRDMWRPPDELAWRFRDAKLRVDVMPTGAAVRTFNILLGEKRRVAAGLIAVE